MTKNHEIVVSECHLAGFDIEQKGAFFYARCRACGQPCHTIVTRNNGESGSGKIRKEIKNARTNTA